MLGPRIAALRRRAGFSQAELADRLKISPSAVGMYEQGRREPSVDTLVEMSRIFGVSTDFLLTGKGTDSTDSGILDDILLQRITAAEQMFQDRRERPFSRQELAVLFAAMLMEP
jgi:transcriptional regulator with XRE-family HTH domain